jgi:hypothetical protein
VESAFASEIKLYYKYKSRNKITNAFLVISIIYRAESSIKNHRQLTKSSPAKYDLYNRSDPT